jgi:RNA polymerase sigma factor (sigma-70 family)
VLNLSRARIRPASDDQLVARFRSGDDAAFAEIVDRYRPRLVRYAASMMRGRSADIADDAVQDVFLRAYSGLRTGDRPMALRAWLYRIAHNRCIDLLRGEQPVELSGEEPAPGGAPEQFERSERLRELVVDIRGLPDQQRSALIIREIDGLSYEEIGAALDVTVPAVKSLLVRARVGLAEAAEAREASCATIVPQLAKPGRRPKAVTRHLSTCAACTRADQDRRPAPSRRRSARESGAQPASV